MYVFTILYICIHNIMYTRTVRFLTQAECIIPTFAPSYIHGYTPISGPLDLPFNVSDARVDYVGIC